MRKLTILKSLIDFIWFVICIPGILVLAFFAIFLFIDPKTINFTVAWFDSAISATGDTSSLTIQVFGVLSIALILLIIYCIYLFRKTLRLFQKAKPFHIEVIENFQKIGYLLSGTGLAASISIFLSRLILKSELKINFGLTPYLMLICLGLFFMVLSEVFKVAKYAKEENDLTI